jgi:hypothetical protein
VEVLSWSWGVSRPAGPHLGIGRFQRKASFNDFVISPHRQGVAAAAQGVRDGEHIKEATITVRKAGSRRNRNT